MGVRPHRWGPLVVVFAFALATSACGARLNDQQVATVNARGARQTAAAPTAGPSKAVAPSATAVTHPGQPAQADIGGAVVAPVDGGAGAPAAEAAGCTPSGGNLDVGITDSSVTVGSVATISGPVPGLFRNVQSGLKAYAAYVNSTGGICGRKLEIQYADDRLDAGTNRS